MSKYVEHAKREFQYAGWMDENGKYKDEMQELICTHVIELLEAFGEHGHSGSSAPYAVSLFSKLALFTPISSIKCTDDEWGTDADTFQNKRLSAVFKKDKDSPPYYLNAIVWKGDDEGDQFTGSVDGVNSHQFIRLPFKPKTFYIDVYREPCEKDAKDCVCCGSGNYEYHIKDITQLKEVAEYYMPFDLPKIQYK